MRPTSNRTGFRRRAGSSTSVWTSRAGTERAPSGVLQLPFPVAAHPPVLDLGAAHTPLAAAVGAANPEGLMAEFDLQRAAGHPPTVAATNPAQRTVPGHGDLQIRGSAI